jgi:hypothetical protein
MLSTHRLVVLIPCHDSFSLLHSCSFNFRTFGHMRHIGTTLDVDHTDKYRLSLSKLRDSYLESISMQFLKVFRIHTTLHDPFINSLSFSGVHHDSTPRIFESFIDLSLISLSFCTNLAAWCTSIPTLLPSFLISFRIFSHRTNSQGQGSISLLEANGLEAGFTVCIVRFQYEHF